MLSPKRPLSLNRDKLMGVLASIFEITMLKVGNHNAKNKVSMIHVIGIHCLQQVIRLIAVKK